MRKSKPPLGFSEDKARYGKRRLASAPRGGSALRALPSPEVLPNGTVRYFLKLAPKGRVLLPAKMRAALGLEVGDRIVAWLKDGEVRLESQRCALEKIQKDGRRLAGGRSVVDELIAERRAAAARGE